MRLTAGRLAAELDPGGAIITGFHWQAEDGEVIPLMRDGASHGGNPLESSCFPLVPFGNRVRDNHFSFDGHSYGLTANQPWDRHYLHGDGWLSEWSVQKLTETSVVLAMSHEAGPASPYAYAATADYAISETCLSVGLAVTNEGELALPFGLGLHPYFPLTPETTLFASAESFYEEAEEFVPGERGSIPNDLDFRRASVLPRRWINNGFAGWDGCAEIRWPERKLALRILGDAAFRNYVVFMSDRRFEPGFAGDYFCFEPMTHAANAHNVAGLGGLAVLAPGQTLRASISFEPHAIPTPSGTVI